MKADDFENTAHQLLKLVARARERDAAVKALLAIAKQETARNEMGHARLFLRDHQIEHYASDR